MKNYEYACKNLLFVFKTWIHVHVHTHTHSQTIIFAVGGQSFVMAIWQIIEYKLLHLSKLIQQILSGYR